jgi:oxygen-independent coproporphyrinogen-3 oxidase
MRTVRHRKPENFLSRLQRNGHGIVEEAALSASEAADEALVMGLRLGEGLDADAMATRFGFDTIVDWGKIDRLVESGHLTREGSRIAPTAAGRLLLDHILAEISATAPSAATGARMRASESAWAA